MSAIFTNDFLQVDEHAISDAQQNPNGVEIMLSCDTFTPSRTTTDSDLTEPDALGYPNYVRYPLTTLPHPATVNTPDNFWSQTFGSVSFDLSGGPGTDTIFGWGAYDPNNGILAYSDTFGAPIAIASLPGFIFVMALTTGVRDVQYP